MESICIVYCLRRNPKLESYWECVPRESLFLKFTMESGHQFFVSPGEKQRKYPLVYVCIYSFRSCFNFFGIWQISIFQCDL